MKRLLRFAGFLLALVPAGWIVGYCAQQWRSMQSSTAQIPLAPARLGEFLVLVPCRGELVAGRSVQITAPMSVQGLQIVWLAPAGEAIKEGDPAIRFDPSAVRQQLVEKEAGLRQAQASLEQAHAEARIREEEDRRALSAARYQVERARIEVSKQEVVSALQGEESRIDLGIAEEKLRTQQATGDMHAAASKARIASLDRVRRQAESEVNLAKRRLETMEVKAPLNGVIVFMPNYSQGWMNAKPFKVGDSVWPGSSIAEIPELASIEMKGKLEEIDRGRIAAGMPVRIHLDPMPEKVFQGKLAALSPLTEQSFEWPPTRSFRASARFQDPDPRLRPGMNGRIDVIVDRIPNAISVPSKAVFTRNGQPVVYRMERGLHVPVQVKVVARNVDEVAIEGLPAGAQVALTEPEPSK